jgi:uncharacterized protein YecT (DUF1311 family)
MYNSPHAGVAQLVRALPCHGRGCGFESRHLRQRDLEKSRRKAVFCYTLFMKIVFNKVTWYSKSLALIVVFIILPALTFCIGRQYEAVSELQDGNNSQETYAEPADPDGYDEEDYLTMNCGDLMYQQAMNQCSAMQRQAAKEKMEGIYKQLIDANFEKEGIQASQNKWQAYADYECDLQGNMVEGGSLEPLIQNECMKKLTEDRIFQLKAWLDLVSPYVPV